MPRAAAMGSEFDARLKKRKADLMEEAERLVIKVFPERYCQLDTLIEDRFGLEMTKNLKVDLQIPLPEQIAVSQSHSEEGPPAKRKKAPEEDANQNNGNVEGTKIVGFVGGVVPSNAQIVELMDILKPIVRDAVESVNKVKMWIAYLIPRIEDGNNFGVSIQEDMLAEVRTVEAEAASFLDQISRYLLQRGRLVCKVAKYPHVEDYRRSIADMDEKQFLNLRLTMMELRNHYGTLHDVITKNLEKIKTPRSNNTGHLY